jgi:hypothetical protein
MPAHRLEMSRIDRETLDAMLGAMVDSFPTFRRYFKAKARRMGKEKLAWWDLFAPAGKVDSVYSWDETRRFILDNFAGFSPELSSFARAPLTARWIDAEPRRGKRGGAFCMGVPGVQRVACADQLRRLARPGLDRGARAGPCFPQRLHVPAKRPSCRPHPHDPGRDGLDHE